MDERQVDHRFRPHIPWLALAVDGLGLLSAAAMAAAAVVLYFRHAWLPALLATASSAIGVFIFAPHLRRMVRWVSGRDTIAALRRAQHEDFERRFAQLTTDSERGNLLADEIAAILDGKGSP
jgi:hypothetical protein